jgi:hypothetical protein
VMTTVELDFVCDVCGRLVADHEGCLVVSFADIHDYRRADREWKQVHGAGPHTVSEVLRLPEAVPWRIHHDACNPGQGGDGYDIDVSRVRTWRALLFETSRLMAKNWLALTDWPQVIGAAAEGRSGRIKALAEGDAA